MKFLIGVLIIIVLVICGNLLSLKYCERTKFIIDFNQFNENLINEVNYSQNTIRQLLNNCPSTVFYITVKDYFLNKKEIEKIKFLAENEFDFLVDYLSKIGKMDKVSQLNYLTYSSKILLKLKDDALLDEKKYKDLYIKMGFLIGLIIMIILL